ncbi:MAG: hypothetical protein ACYTGW_23065 [Planctomycetota bacterium]|jgi:hypothetical protein
MSCDRFIRFKKGKAPSHEDVGKALEDYLGAFMTSNKWDQNRWLAQLDGGKSWPFKRLEADSRRAWHHEEEARECRYIEVWFSKNSIDVLTRRADEATMNLADGFAKLIARYWGGKLEMEE